MIRLLIGVRLKDDADRNAFLAFWNGQMAADLQRFVDKDMVDRIAMSQGVGMERNRSVAASMGTQPPFDGLIELFWANGQALETAQNNPEFVGLFGRITSSVRQFVDTSNSVFSYTETPANLAGHSQSILQQPGLDGYEVDES